MEVNGMFLVSLPLQLGGGRGATNNWKIDVSFHLNASGEP